MARVCIHCEAPCPPGRRYCSDQCRRVVGLAKKRVSEARRIAANFEEIRARERARYHIAKTVDLERVYETRRANMAQQRARIASMSDVDREAHLEARRKRARIQDAKRRAVRLADPEVRQRYLEKQADARRKRRLRTMMAEI